MNRRSTWFNRSPYSAPFWIRLTSAVPDENGRPSPGQVQPSAHWYRLLAATTGPVTLCSVPLIRMSYHGSTYDADPLICVSIGSDTLTVRSRER